jgi:hypothetical protein
MVRRTSPRAVALIVFMAFSVETGYQTAKAQRGGDKLETLNQQTELLYQAGKYAMATETRSFDALRRNAKEQMS